MSATKYDKSTQYDKSYNHSSNLQLYHDIEEYEQSLLGRYAMSCKFVGFQILL